MKQAKPPSPPPRQRKTLADLRRDLAAGAGLGAAEQEALLAAGLRAPNMRLFTLNSVTAWDLFRPPPSMLPAFPPCWLPKVERDRG